ncbi:ligand-binding sensor domain-containing diguanylate cyclase [Rhodospirillum centenum]|uniref:ligand-binding sensor domain-containing diguanylate cyclase n=1 Tax=Rhodospirillum centenum TaxID=34018 RepID=UPI00059EEF53|nr:ligand-binding sensor domain-containing diguanylate cyclase [Rhodospirillum centenum]
MLALILAALALAPPARANDHWQVLATPAFDSIGQRDGLPHPIVTAVVQDAQGFMWVGTQGGLSRFDGYRLRTYLATPSDPAGLPHAYILALHVDHAGRLWVGTAGAGAAWYDETRDRFIPLSPDRGMLPHPLVQDFADDGRGGLWIATRGGLAHRTADGTLVTVSQGVPDPRISSLLRDDRGAVWIGTQGGLARVAPDGDGPRPFPGLPEGMAARVLGKDAADRIHVAVTTSDNDQLWRGGVDGFTPVKGADGQNLGFPRGSLVRMVDTGTGSLWIATLRDGIIELEAKTGRTHPIRHDRADDLSLADDVLFALFRDRGGMIWVGTRNGLSRVDAAAASVTSIRYSPLRREGLSGADIMAVDALSDGRVAVGYLAGGIDILDPRDGVVERLPPGGLLPDGAVLAVRLHAGRYYVGMQHGLAIIDPVARTVSRPTMPDPDRVVHSLLFREGRLLLGGRAGLFVLGASGKTVERFRCVAADGTDAAAGLANAMSLLNGPDGRLWAGTPDGLHAVDTGTCTGQVLRHDPADPASLPEGLLSVVRFDSQGRPWVGTMGSGLAVGEPGGGTRFRTLTTADGLPNNNIGEILEDRTGAFWISTADGIGRVAPDLTVTAFRAAEGVSLPAYWARSGAATPAGDMLFGAGGGLTVIEPAELGPHRPHPPVRLTGLRAGGVEQPVGLYNGTRMAPPLVLPGQQRSLSVDFAALGYVAADLMRYRVRLDGFDSDWTDRGPADRSVAYTNLPPGDYVLRIQAVAPGEDWGADDFTLDVRVEAGWYQTNAFRALMVMLAALLVVAIVQGRTSVLRRRQAQLQKEVAERTRELELANRRLEQLANTDPLTGILNHRAFWAALEAEWDRACRYGRVFSVLQIDMDHFKRVNDTYGHAAGDAVLQTLTDRVGRLLRSVDRFGRLGGEEFAVLLPDTGYEGAVQVAERILDAIRTEPVLFEGTAIPISASIGGSSLRPDDANVNVILHRADAALYAAKGRGRSQAAFAEDGAGWLDQARPA